ncbi:MAG: DUF3868 domain-containing protein [Bacteroides sp.]|uniref:DUF3868 domain-containing protein n=1 Tax=Bacteroides sp. TaxID=29523 RepID=UPI002FC7E4C8
MKLVFISVIFILGATGVFAQQKEYAGKMHITPLSLEQKGDSVYVKLNFDIAGINVDSRRSISLIPTLVAPDKRLNLPEVMVKGRENYNVYRRELALMSKRERDDYEKNPPYVVLEGFKSTNNKQIAYQVAIKYEPWMAQAKLDMYEDLCGCGNAPRRMGVSQLVNLITLEKVRVLEAYSITPHLAYVQPAVETVKYREVIGEAFLDFAVNSMDIRSGYMNNPRELKKITDLIAEVKRDKDITLRAINVMGYASPEGTLEANRRLSEGRANALAEYLSTRFDYPRDLYKVVFGGENWSGLRERVESSSLPYRDQVLAIIDTIPAEINYAQKSSRKKALMDLQGGVPYRYMLKEIFPSLRKAICKIDFEVRNFDIEQAKEVMKRRPQNLSLNEIFLLANTYKEGSREFIDLFETAVRLFPDDVTANVNAASAALARKDVPSAQRYLSKVKGRTGSAEYYNAAGVLQMLRGNYDEAEILLDKASVMGLAAAKQNKEELTRKRANSYEMESINRENR